jgi:putative phage-type endonuclease
MIEQRTPEWLAARCGKWTGSKFVDVMAKKTTQAYQKLIWSVVAERVSGTAADNVSGYALAWGTEVEPFAREAYELATGNIVEEFGFLQHPEYPFAGASPDGLIGIDGGLELKCPWSSAVHLERFLSGVPAEYIPQIQGCMWVTGRQWWDFASFDPRMPEKHRLLVIRVNRDDEFISRLSDAVLGAEAAAVDLQARLERIAA